jgi:AcrR family transcriptional regulator
VAQNRTVKGDELRANVRALWKAGNTRTRDHERKRAAVILTAARAFRSRGYHNTSLDDIANELNVTKPTVYHYVATKEQLLFECFRSGLNQIMESFGQPEGVPPRSARERLDHVIRRYAEAITSDFGWCMVQAENQDLSPAMSRNIKSLKSNIDQGIRQLLEEGARDGSIRRCDAKITSFALAGALNWIAHWYRTDEPLSAGDIAARFIELFELGLTPR